MMKITIPMAVLVLSACGTNEQWGAWMGQADAHLSPAAPDALATLHVELRAYTPDQARTMKVTEVWIAPDAQTRRALAIALAGDQVTVPATMASTTYVLDNRGVTNGDLQAWCQTTVPLQVGVDFPVGGNTPLVLDAALAVFCP